MEKLIYKIAENMIKTRPQKDVVLRPFLKNKAVSKHVLASVNVDLDKIYPYAETGDTVYVKTVLIVPFENDAVLGFWGNVEAFLDGKKLDRDGDGYAPIRLKGGEELIFHCRKGIDGFGVSFTLSTVHYRGMWASDYLYWIRYTLPGEYTGEEGVAITDINSTEYIFPPETFPENHELNFENIFNDKSGDYAFALTYAVADTCYAGEGELFVNNEHYSGGMIKAGSSIMLRTKRENGIKINTGNDEYFKIPFIESERKHGTKWLLLGPLSSDKLPEIQFKKPYENRFWRLADGSYIRPCLDTSFYGKWFYALMVGQYGILKTSKIIPELKKYYIEGMSILADYYELMQHENEIFGAPSFLERSTHLYELDPIGTVGMNLCDLYEIAPSENVMNVIKALKNAMYRNIARFDDGTFHRTETMWADDTFMSLPFLARLGKITQNYEYFDECANQIKGFYDRLYMPDKNLFSHIYFLKDEKPNRVPWGRGNGWVFLALSEVLERIPDEHSKKAELIKIFREFAEGIRNVQDKSGMWHQVLDMEGTYEETSCTGMFALGMIRGIKFGWINQSYIENIHRAVDAISKYAVDNEGNILGVCKGSGCSYNPEYYAQLQTVTNDDHGTGIILAMLSEYKELKF